MANRMTTPKPELKGAMARTMINPHSGIVSSVPQREISRDYGIDLLSQVMDMGAKVGLKKMQEQTDENERVLLADQKLNDYRIKLSQARDDDELSQIEKGINQELYNTFNQDREGKSFWLKNGQKIIDANARDSELIRQNKEIEFGKDKTRNVLALAQNMLAYSDSKRANNLLNLGVEEISRSPFLNDEDKKAYRQDYLRTGLLNMAINNPDEAKTMALSIYDGEDKDVLLENIEQVKKIAEDNKAKRDEEAKKAYQLSLYKDAINAWQNYADGQISDEAYYVLKQKYGKDILWGDEENSDKYPFYSAYLVLRSEDNGDVSKFEDICMAGNGLVSAFKHKTSDKDKIFWLQNKLVEEQIDNDRDVYEFMDRLYGEDADNFDNELNKTAMNEKAKCVFDLYRELEMKANALAQDYMDKNNGRVLLTDLKKFKDEAMREMAKDYGFSFEKSAKTCAFNQLKKVMNGIYQGGEQAEIWKRYYDRAPFVSDKIDLMRKIATDMQRETLMYPRFDSVKAMQKAHLEVGDKFYLNGRLAILRG